MSFIRQLSDTCAAPMLGRYVCAHSSPCAFYGYLLAGQEVGGIAQVVLADAALWTQGMTVDLIVPGHNQRAHMPSGRMGLVSVMAVTAIQPAGALGDEPLVQRERPGHWYAWDDIPGPWSLLRSELAGPGEWAGISRALRDAYGTKSEGNQDAVIAYAKTVLRPDLFLPVRVATSILLDRARALVW